MSESVALVVFAGPKLLHFSLQHPCTACTQHPCSACGRATPLCLCTIRPPLVYLCPNANKLHRYYVTLGNWEEERQEQEKEQEQSLADGLSRATLELCAVRRVARVCRFRRAVTLHTVILIWFGEEKPNSLEAFARHRQAATVRWNSPFESFSPNFRREFSKAKEFFSS